MLSAAAAGVTDAFFHLHVNRRDEFKWSCLENCWLLITTNCFTFFVSSKKCFKNIHKKAIGLLHSIFERCSLQMTASVVGCGFDKNLKQDGNCFKFFNHSYFFTSFCRFRDDWLVKHCLDHNHDRFVIIDNSGKFNCAIFLLFEQKYSTTFKLFHFFLSCFWSCKFVFEIWEEWECTVFPRRTDSWIDFKEAWPCFLLLSLFRIRKS